MEKIKKYKKGLVGDVKEEMKFEKQQDGLRGKYNLDVPSDVIVVEKSNVYKFTVSALAAMIRKAAAICILILAAIGLMTLLYPDVRRVFMKVLGELLSQLYVYLPFLNK